MSTHLIDHDQQQRRLALDPSQSFIVQAPAGSGKTELLIQRFLTLLNHVNAPEEILAITFTKKAANEMRMRIVNALKQAADDIIPITTHGMHTYQLAKKVLSRDTQLHWHLIQNPNQLRIQTIDSLCAYLTKQLPILSHFGAQPQITNYPYFLYQEAVAEVLMHVEENFTWSSDVAKLLSHVDNDFNKLCELLVNLLSKRDQWLPYIHFIDESNTIRQQLENDLKHVIANHLTHLRNCFPLALANELLTIARFAADQLKLDEVSSPLLDCRNLTELPGTSVDELQLWKALASLLFTKKFEFRKRFDASIGFPALSSLKQAKEKLIHTAYRQRLSQLIEKLREHEEVREVLTELFFLPPATYRDDQWEILQALLQVLKVVIAQLRVVFQHHGLIDFIENALAALTALGAEEQPTNLALVLDYQIRHILVDEFQDTSFTQYQLLEKLLTGWEKNDGRTLFVVGDPMQSIYRFREAEVGLFIRMAKTGIANLTLVPITLSVNFRSDTQIVQWNNHHFQSLFPTFNDIGKGAVTYSPSVTINASIHKQSSVSVNDFINTDEKEQANHIVAFIKAVQNEHPQENIAILVRSRTHLTHIIPALKQAQLPYHALDIDPLEDKQCIQDVFSLTCALLHPGDRIAWLGILRAPWCGLTLADLFTIAGESAYKTIWEQLNQSDVIQALTADGVARVTKFNAVINQQMQQRERQPLRDWIEGTWLLLGGPACLNDYSEMDDIAVYFNLLEECDQASEFVDIQKLKEKMHQLYATTQDHDASLQLMTIHSAKGLEFDTVILPHLECKLPHDQKSLLRWMEYPLSYNQMALLLAPVHGIHEKGDPLYEYIHRQQKLKSDYEIDRLLYVGATRAKKRLCLLFNVTQTADDYTITPGSFLEKLWPYVKSSVHSSSCRDSIAASSFPDPLVPDSDPVPRDDSENKIEQSSFSKPIHRFATHWKNPIQHTQHALTIHQKPGGFQLVQDNAILIGTVVHQMLQRISELSFHWWTGKNFKEQIAYIHLQLAQLGMQANDIINSIPTIRKAIENALSDTRGRWILSQQIEAKSELALTAWLDDRLEHFILDRTFIDEHNTRWIIDYKTTTFSHQDVQQFLLKEQKKYLDKMQSYARAMQLTDTRPIRLGLYFPMLPAWHEWCV